MRKAGCGVWFFLSGLMVFSQALGAELSAKITGHTVRVEVNGELFTEYLFTPSEKYPYFYPVIGPASGRSVTTRRTQPWPHHSSIFFGCDRVNKGNYWQEDISRGQIVPIQTCVRRTHGETVQIEQTCRWRRADAPEPFEDHRLIYIWAPAKNLRAIEFTITLRPLIPVRIERSNHSLFSVRMAPDLSVQGGGVLINSNGDQSEKGTFGKKAEWVHAYGERNQTIEGVVVLDHRSNPWYPSPWFTRDYGFFSPTPMNWLPDSGLERAPGQNLKLRYLVLIHSGPLPPERINRVLEAWNSDRLKPGDSLP